MKRKHLSWNQPHEFEDDEENSIFFVLDYYQRAFTLFHDELERSGYNSKIVHPIRKHFWGLLPYRNYLPLEITPFIQQYIEILERELKEIISKNSLAYWLHLYRRLFPEAIGLDTSPMTIGEIRATLESAIQKYAQFQPCERVRITGQIEIGEVLGGLLMEPEFELERENLQSMKQLVLTDFSFTELRSFYDVERLAYELWRSSAMLRIVGKGSVIVVNDSDTCVFDLRSDELSQLVRRFDDRYSKNSMNFQLLSSKGLVYDVEKVPSGELGGVFLPTYNLDGIPIKNFDFFFDKFGIDFSKNNELQTNFIWVPYSFRQYREAHIPFAEAFNEKYGVGLDAVLLVVAALCQRVFITWNETEGMSIFRFWQRAYEGPYTRKYIVDEIQAFLPLALKLLGIRKKHIDRKELHKAIHFWELDETRQQSMDLAYSGPHSIFLPYGNDRLFIDYAWISTEALQSFCRRQYS